MGHCVWLKGEPGDAVDEVGGLMEPCCEGGAVKGLGGVDVCPRSRVWRMSLILVWMRGQVWFLRALRVAGWEA